MKTTHLLAGATALVLMSAGAVPAPTVAVHPAYAACDPGTPLNNTTADWAVRIMRRAGFSDVKVDQKGCDNVWHVFASRDGQRGRYAIEPGGKIYPEGN